MSIRTKLVGAFLLVALLVPILGGVAARRVQGVERNVETLSRDAVPTMLLVKEVDAIQREQQRAVLSYVAGGAAEDRDRYTALTPERDAKLDDLTAAVNRDDQGAAAKSDALVQQVVEERAKFDAAAAQLIAARATIESNSEAVRLKGEEMVAELTVLRNRFVPTAAAGIAGQAEPSRAPITLRNQINELLLGTEGMLSIVGFEAALATGYVITVDPRLRQRFEDASAVFANWLRVANNAAGPDDRVILARVETKFYQEFEPTARALMAAADASTEARGQFGAASAGISARLDELTGVQSGTLAEARGSAQSAVTDTGRIVLVVTLIAFLAAGALGVWFAGTITGPIRRLRDVADQVSTGNLSTASIETGTRDEVADLAEAFRRMVVSVRYLMMGAAGNEAGDSRLGGPAGR